MTLPPTLPPRIPLSIPPSRPRLCAGSSLSPRRESLLPQRKGQEIPQAPAASLCPCSILRPLCGVGQFGCILDDSKTRICDNLMRTRVPFITLRYFQSLHPAMALRVGATTDAAACACDFAVTSGPKRACVRPIGGDEDGHCLSPFLRTAGGTYQCRSS